MGTMNLLKETTNMLNDNGKQPSDVRWVQFEGFWCTWDEFQAAAAFDYDNGYGGAEIEPGLKVVGNDWWLERGEYDGSEWWEFKTLPARPENHRTPESDDLKDRWAR